MARIYCTQYKEKSMVLSQARTWNLTRALTQTAGVALFAALTGLAARVAIPLPFTPIPFTLQVFVVLLAGLTLGARGGAVSQIAYLAAITAGLPLDARMLGPAVWLAPTAGYLVGFIAAAFAVGWIAERLSGKTPAAKLIAGAVGVACIYLCGVSWLTILFLHGDLLKGFLAGAAPFLVLDLIKALMAATAAGLSRDSMHRFFGGQHDFGG
jgi:biotin transport system substrate-specific component